MKDLAKAAEVWGISTEYEDSQGNIKKVPEETVLSVLHLMDDSAPPPQERTSIQILRRKSACHFPRKLRTWGWAVQLYAARSQKSWGIGDLGDLKELGTWAANMGAGLIMINPLHAVAPAKPQQASPYFPSSRVYRNPLYLRIEDVPGSQEAGLDELAGEGRALNASRFIDRDAIFDLKLRALERIWESGAPKGGFEDYIKEEGETLLDYATYCVAVEKYGISGQTWPSSLRSRSPDSVEQLQEQTAGRIRFHQWIQWLIHQQLDAASKEISIVSDLAIGVDPAGADAWMWQDIFVDGASIGAPPDEFNEAGQVWGLCPMDPWKLASNSFEPFQKTLSASFRRAGGLRIDHVMGLFRQFWVPDGITPGEGTYVRYPAQALLEKVAGESRRNEALVIGEDLGTVEQGVRDEMAQRKMLSQRVLWFESGPPESWPMLSMASVTTHDLPTIAGLWSGSDLALQRRFGQPNEEATEALIKRLASTLRLPQDTPIEDVIRATHEQVARASSAIAVAGLDDAAAVEERPNLPGSRRPENWSLALPVSLEGLYDSRLATDIAAILRERPGGV